MAEVMKAYIWQPCMLKKTLKVVLQVRRVYIASVLVAEYNPYFFPLCTSLFAHQLLRCAVLFQQINHKRWQHDLASALRRLWLRLYHTVSTYAIDGTSYLDISFV